VLVSEAWYDLAVIRIVTDLEGNPVERDFTALELGDSDRVGTGAELVVLAFPSAGGDTLSVTRGIVSGFLADEKLGISRGWIKTDAVIRPGSSGGLAAVDGRLIGVPTRGQTVLDHLRPINLAKPLIADALAGRRYVRHTGVVETLGSEEFTFSGWGTALDELGCVIDPASGFRSGVAALYAGFEYTAMPSGLDLWGVFFRDDEVVGLVDWAWPPDLGSGSYCDAWVHGNPEDGLYEFVLLAGPTLAPVARATTEVGMTTDTVAITGIVKDANTERPIAEALIIFLRADTDLDAWLDNPTDDEVVGVAESGANGRFTLSGRFELGSGYAYIMWAEGYIPLVGCCYEVPGDATDPLDVSIHLAPVR
jgi:hypothetical protein